MSSKNIRKKPRKTSLAISKKPLWLFQEPLPVFENIQCAPSDIYNFEIKDEWETPICEPHPDFENCIEYISLERLYEVYKKTCKHKTTTKSCITFQFDLIPNLYCLYKELNCGSYKISPSLCFCVVEPCKREVFAAIFRDRIVHHLFIDHIQYYLEKLFIDDVYACRPLKGNLFAIKRLKEYAESQNWDGTLIKLDIQGYFVSISKVRLYGLVINILDDIFNDDLLSMSYNDLFEMGLYCILNIPYQTLNKNYINRYREWLLWIAHKIIFNCPQKNCIVIQSPTMWSDLPHTKSMFYKDALTGMPVGNHTSQWFANLFLDVLDKYITQTLGLKMYGRYVDDFYIIVPQDYPLTPNQIVKKIRKVCENIGIKLHPHKIYIQPLSSGCDFTGYFIKPHRIFIRKRTLKKFISLLDCVHAITLENDFESAIDGNFRKNIRARLNSYLGMISYTNSYRLKKRLFKKYMSDLLKIGISPNKNLSKVCLVTPHTKP